MFDNEYDSDVPPLTDSDNSASSTSDSEEDQEVIQDTFERHQKMLTESVDETQAKLKPVKHEKGLLDDNVDNFNRQLEDELHHRQSLQTQLPELQREVASTTAIQSSSQMANESSTHMMEGSHLSTHMREGSHAYIGGQYKIAALYYRKALDVLSTEPTIRAVEDEQALLKYALGMSEVNLNRVKNAQSGMQFFERILAEHQKNLHIIGQFGLAVSYYKQNRFPEAIKPLQECLSLIECNLVALPYHWPGTNTVIEDFSTIEHLEIHVKDLLLQCKTPPQPDALCRYPDCVHLKRQIYYTDSECEGFVSIHCEEKCLVEFHLDCWKRLKVSSYDKRSDKEMLNTACVTPDCKQPIVRIRFRDSEGKIYKEVPSSSPEFETKAKKVSSNVKGRANKGTERKKDKGHKEKVGKSDTRTGVVPDKEKEKPVESGKSEKSKDTVEIGVAPKTASELDITGNSTTASSSFPILPPDATNFIAIHKKANDDEEYVVTKQKKGKRIRDRPKPTVVHLEEFQQRDGEYAGDDYIGEDGNGNESPPFSFGARYSNTSSNGWDNEFLAIPLPGAVNLRTLPHLHSSQSERSHQENFKPVRYKASNQENSPAPIVESPGTKPTEEEMKETIFSLFEQLLHDGPLEPEGELVQKELEVLPTEAQVLICQSGGIAKLLQESLKFTASDGYICLLRHTALARSKAQGRRQALLLSALRPPASATARQLTKSGLNPPQSSETKPSNPNSHTLLISNTVKQASLNPLTPSKSTGYSAPVSQFKKPSSVIPLGNTHAVAGGLPTNGGMNSASKGSASSSSSISISNTVSLFQNTNPNFSASNNSNHVPSGITSASTVQLPTAYNIWKSGVPVVNKQSQSAMYGQAAVTNSSSGPLKMNMKSTNVLGSGNISDSYSAATVQSHKLSEEKLSSQSNQRGLLDTLDDTSLEDVDDVYRSDEDSEISVKFKTTVSGECQHSFKDNEILISSGKKDNSQSNNQVKSVVLSVTAPEFVYRDSKYRDLTVGSPGIIDAHGSSACAVTDSSGFRGLGTLNQKSKNVPTLSVEKVDKFVETDESWTEELANAKIQLISMKAKYDCEQERFIEKLEEASRQLKEAKELRVTLENEKVALVESWKLEKNQLVERVEILQQEVSFYKDNLERTYHKVYHFETKQIEMDRKQVELTRLLAEEQEKSRVLKAECEQLQKLNELLESKNAAAAYDQRLRFPQTASSISTANQTYAYIPEASVLGLPYGRPVAIGLNGMPSTMGTTAGSVNTTSASLMSQPNAMGDGSKSKQNFDKILARLSGFFPDMRSSDLSGYVQKVRASRNNTLTGLKMQEIFSLVQAAILREKMLNERERVQQLSAITSNELSGFQAGERSNSGPGSSAGDDEMFQEEENPCIVCHEELSADTVSKLDCGHTYHTKCIRQWFNEQSTCPTCRNHSLLREEYPPLAQLGGANGMMQARRQPIFSNHRQYAK